MGTWSVRTRRAPGIDRRLVCGMGLVMATAAGCDGSSSGGRGEGVEAGAGGARGDDAGSAGVSSGGVSSGGVSSGGAASGGAAESDAGSGGSSSGGASTGSSDSGGPDSGSADSGSLDDPSNCGEFGHVCPPVVIADDRKEPVALAVHGADLYWVESGSFTAEDCLGISQAPTACFWINGHSAHDGVLSRIPLDGGTPVVLAEDLAGPVRLFVDPEGAHVATGEGIFTVPLEGGAPRLRYSGPGGYVGADGESFYVSWGVEGSNLTRTTHLSRVPRDGSEPVPLGVLEGGARGFAMDATHVYVLVLGVPGTTLQKVPVQGGPAVTVATLADGDGPLLVAEGRAFFVDKIVSPMQILQVSTEGGEPTPLAGRATPVAMTSAPSALWFTSPTPGWTPSSGGLFRLPLAQGSSPVPVAQVVDRVTAVATSGRDSFWTTVDQTLPATRPAPGVSLHRPGHVMRAGRCVNAVCE